MSKFDNQLLKDMPGFEIDGKKYENPVELVLDQLGGRWKMALLWRLKDQVWRYGELRSSLKHVTHKMLTQQLRELEADGYIHRQVYAVVPPKVEYSLTEKGKTAVPIILLLRDYGLWLMQEAGISEEKRIN
ncbi:MAG: winged helix-turn-helix transcriptional regulator [Sphingobacteriia bacterium]